MDESKPWIAFTTELPFGKEYRCVSCAKYFFPPNIRHIGTWDNRCLQCLDKDYLGER